MGTSNNTYQSTSIGLCLLLIISMFTTTNVLATSSLVTTTTTTNVYDSFGNPTSITVTVTDGTDTFTTATTNSYNNNDTDWHLGRLVCAEVTQTIPGSPSPVSATRVSGFEYNANGLLSKEVIEPTSSDITEPSGVSDCVTHSSDNNITLITDYGYDAFGNKTTVTVDDGAGGIDARTTTTAYDARGQFATSTTNALGHSETRTYDAKYGVMLTLEGPNQLTTSWTYDSFGRQIKETRADGTETAITREWCDGFLGETGNLNCPTGGALALTTTTTGAPTTVAYSDALGREIRVETEGFAATGSTVKAVYVDTVYDAQGRIDKKSRPYFEDVLTVNIKWHTFTYDVLSRPLTETSPDNSVETTAYNGLETIVTNSKNQVNKRINNARGELIQVVDADTNVTDYRYDAFGNLIEVEDALYNTTINTYDIRGRKLTMDDPDMGYWTYAYNALGELTSQTDAELQTVTMTYDLLGRMLTRVENEGTSTWTYDTTGTYAAGQAAYSIGKLISVSSAEGKDETYTFDSLGRLASTDTTIDTVTYTTEQTYDLQGRLETITYPDSHHYSTGFQITNEYNAEGYLETVTDGTTDYWTANSQNAEGQLTQFTFGNGVDTEQLYDANTGLITNIATGTVGTNTIQDLSFTFDTLGNLTQRQDYNQGTPSLTEDFIYDVLNRMTSSELDDGTTITTKSYTYDAIGNLLTKTGIGTYTYGAGSAGPHAVTSVLDTGSNTRTFGYDANGNMTSSWNFTSSKTRTITYTSYNKPSQITQGTSPNDTTLTFSYGANREQFKQVVSSPTESSTRTYINSYYEKDVNGSLTTHIHYIKAGGSTVAMYKSKSDNNEETRYLHKDHLGSITEITDDTAAVVERLSYDPHGKRRLPSWNDALAQLVGQETKRCFTGHQYLDDVGLIHMGGRVYDPDLGRFLSPDPFVQEPGNAQNLNRYSYVLNNPLSYTDPSGFFFKKIFKAIKSIVKGAVKAVKSVVKAVASEIKTIAAIAATAVGTHFGCPQCGGFAAGLISSGGDLKAGILGAVTAHAFTELHQFVPTTFGEKFAKVVAHGSVGGVSAELQGGDFLSGFASAGATQAFALSGGFDALGLSETPDGLGEYVHNAAVASVVGGTASVLGGGKFKNGALTGSFSRLFNDLKCAGGKCWDVKYERGCSGPVECSLYGPKYDRNDPATAAFLKAQTQDNLGSFLSFFSDVIDGVSYFVPPLRTGLGIAGYAVDATATVNSGNLTDGGASFTGTVVEKFFKIGGAPKEFSEKAGAASSIIYNHRKDIEEQLE